MLTSGRRCDFGRQFQYLDWGKPAQITSPSLDCSSPRIPFSVPGDMYALRPSDDTTGNPVLENPERTGTRHTCTDRCPRGGESYPQEIDADLISRMIDQNCSPSGYLVELTNKGHILQTDGLSHEDSIRILRYLGTGVRPTRVCLLNRGTQLRSGPGDRVFLNLKSHNGQAGPT